MIPNRAATTTPTAANHPSLFAFMTPFPAQRVGMCRDHSTGDHSKPDFTANPPCHATSRIPMLLSLRRRSSSELTAFSTRLTVDGGAFLNGSNRAYQLSLADETQSRWSLGLLQLSCDSCTVPCHVSNVRWRGHNDLASAATFTSTLALAWNKLAASGPAN